MSTRGRKAELKAIDGGLKGVPLPPDSVPESMIAEWNAIGADMAERQILTTPALGLLESYLIARWSAQEAQKAIAEHGVLTKTAHQMLKPNPANGLLSKSLEAVARLGAELGISPASRSKGQFQPKGGQDDKGAPSGLAV
ncbi:P27 family phage terminase small subunit [Brucella intermedia GD04153]|uniref:P27 family phage terminase small subunit n=1 Tax=Brucella intermedia GD04153 TaxID=2975438 RepID=A0AA42H2U9_9HYPH|nr:P27 family phage terminase small subunit [Brucella intermedia]MDH0127070.1 P27 family phage terminase small subunit [Brucella intermedia GD04153]